MRDERKISVTITVSKTLTAVLLQTDSEQLHKLEKEQTFPSLCELKERLRTPFPSLVDREDKTTAHKLANQVNMKVTSQFQEHHHVMTSQAHEELYDPMNSTSLYTRE